MEVVYAHRLEEIKLASFEIIREKSPVKEIVLRISREELLILIRNTEYSGHSDDHALFNILEEAKIGSYS